MPLLEIRNLQVDFGETRVVDGVSLTLEKGRTLGLVGESGCGKSVTALSVAKLLPTPPARYARGEILLRGENVLSLPPARLRAVRGGVVGYVFQDPSAALNPVLRIRTQILEALQLHRPDQASDHEVVRLLQLVGIPAPESRARDFPHQLSGGMQQRVVIAMALACRPDLLIADEPTTALDVTIQAQVLDLLRQLQTELGMAILLITHNLGIVGDLADHLAVMYAGEIVEFGPAEAVLKSPRHPYTRALVASVPELGQGKSRLQGIPGTVPSPGHWPAGCRFEPRCGIARPECRAIHPTLDRASSTHPRLVRCPFAPP